MTYTILEPNRLKRCVAALVSGGTAPNDRAELEGLVATALVAPVAFDEYLGAFGAAQVAAPVPEAALGEFPIEAILGDGLGVLSDEQLARLARSPGALTELHRLVDDALGREAAGVYWLDAELLPDEVIPKELHDAAERGVATFQSHYRKTKPSTELNPKRWLTLALPVALAASLMLAFFLGTRWAGERERDVQLASFAVRGDVTRGIEDVALDIGNGANRRVFLTVVGIVPGRKAPGVFYRHQGKYLELPASGTTTLKNFPPSDFDGSTVLLLVATDVPAGDAVLNVLPATLTPQTAHLGAEHIRASLHELGIASVVRIIPLRSTTK